MFSYLRLFPIVCLIAVIILSVAAGLQARTVAVDEMSQATHAHGMDIAQGYVQTVWNKYNDALIEAATEPAKLKTDPRIAEFAAATVRYFQPLSLPRVNLYNGAGVLLMTVKAQDSKIEFIGNTPTPGSGFVAKQIRQSAAGHKLWEDLLLADQKRMTLLQMVVPFRAEGGHVEGAIEIIQDVDARWRTITDFQLYGTGGVIAIFALFMGVWFFSARQTEAVIAKQYETNLELAAAAAAAQAENRDKSQFLANVSHELRTPLNAIIGFSEIIKTEVMQQVQDRRYHDYINDIHSSGVHLLSLINDILEYSKAEAGKLELEVSDVNAVKMIQNCMRLVGPRAESGQVKLIETLPKEPIVLMTDGKKFKQVLLNLLSNSVKFTPPGGEVKVSAWRDVNEDSYSFEVKDTGIGIAAKDISRAMAPFGQVDNTLSRKYEGTGLGLPLTKKFVELMGGKFTIESEVNVGTTVTFTLPRVLAERDGVVIKQLS